MTEPIKPLFSNANIISQYSRLRAIEDGVLVDVSVAAKATAFTFPVAITRAAWEKCVAWDKAAELATGHVSTEEIRLNELLWILATKIRNAGEKSAGQMLFQVPVVDRNEGRQRSPTLVPMKAVCGPGDTAAPVVTVMLIGED